MLTRSVNLNHRSLNSKPELQVSAERARPFIGLLVLGMARSASAAEFVGHAYAVGNCLYKSYDAKRLDLAFVHVIENYFLSDHRFLVSYCL